jgi:hypothetical protein
VPVWVLPDPKATRRVKPLAQIIMPCNSVVAAAALAVFLSKQALAGESIWDDSWLMGVACDDPINPNHDLCVGWVSGFTEAWYIEHDECTAPENFTPYHAIRLFIDYVRTTPEVANTLPSVSLTLTLTQTFKCQ